ncbi:hypothetical protein KUTeg_021981 [Tegillarca granosa]|uniref:Uncharacterized protein n=1 Tax=Tegillarca granosa TaxID=220873 RepID=A0ABQ9EA89_TEGGR|nr:hypothetical protein KUTeg_021981 [Tegillarca granosa]
MVRRRRRQTVGASQGNQSINWDQTVIISDYENMSVGIKSSENQKAVLIKQLNYMLAIRSGLHFTMTQIASELILLFAMSGGVLDTVSSFSIHQNYGRGYPRRLVIDYSTGNIYYSADATPSESTTTDDNKPRDRKTYCGK